MSTVFVGNLSPEVTDSDLRSVFEHYGRITSLRLVSRRRMAYIELDEEAAKAAIDGLTGTQLKGRTLDIVMDMPTGGGRPGGRRRRGRR